MSDRNALQPDEAPSGHFDTFEHYRQAVGDLLAHAERTLSIFDPDLSHTGLEHKQSVALLETLCRKTTQPDAIRILLIAPSHLQKHCPRLLRLVEQQAHRISIRLVSNPGVQDLAPFMIADQAHLLTRFHPDTARGKLALDDASQCAQPGLIFEGLWMASKPGPTGMTLGL